MLTLAVFPLLLGGAGGVQGGAPWAFAAGGGVLGAQEVTREGHAHAPGARNPEERDPVSYNRAEGLLGWNLEPLVLGFASDPHWIGETDRFWYQVRTERGMEFVRVDPTRGSRGLLFDNARLAAAMSLAADTSFEPSKLPFRSFELADGEGEIRFQAPGRRFHCDIRLYRCTLADTTEARPQHHVASPDGTWEAFIHDYDLWVRRVASPADSLRLTVDGEEYFRYGESSPKPTQIVRGTRSSPVLEWSPDSKKIAVQRLDERDVGLMPLYSSTHQRPRSFLYKDALPGDSVIPRFSVHVVDVEEKTNLEVRVPPQPTPMSGFAGMVGEGDWATVKWSPDSRHLYLTDHVRGRYRVQLQEADLATGEPGPILAKDTAATYVELNLTRRGAPNWFVLGGGREVIWFSEGDGWGHLYLYDGQGKVKNQITSGPWTVGDVLHVDEESRTIYFTARGREPGRNPYYAHLYRVGFDGSGLTLLTPENGDHTVDFSPDGRYFVDRVSAPDDPGATFLRAVPDGRTVLPLEVADVSRLRDVGWRPPEVISVKARDGTTELWGLLYTPSRMDQGRRYPVIVHPYPGPQIGSVGTWGFDVSRRGEDHGLAELGFMVLQLDALGTPYRSKAFHDFYYGNMGDNGIPDQIAAVKELASRRPSMDLDRVGIYGHSGGGFTSTDAILRYPDFFKVAVSGSGNHDNRTYSAYWGEQYQGLLVRDTLRGTDNYENQVNARLAGNLRGKLLLMHGDMDDNVHPAMTLQMVDALIKANKSFDLLIVPNRNHGLNEPYVIRRRWDYFVKNLLGAEPPENYEIRPPHE